MLCYRRPMRWTSTTLRGTVQATLRQRHRARDLRHPRHRRCPHANKCLINIARGCHRAGARTMTNAPPDTPLPAASRLRPRAFLLREWPYLLMLVLALLGVAYTSFSHAPMATYWIALAPFIGLLCVMTRWNDAGTRD